MGGGDGESESESESEGVIGGEGGGEEVRNGVERGGVTKGGATRGGVTRGGVTMGGVKKDGGVTVKARDWGDADCGISSAVLPRTRPLTRPFRRTPYPYPSRAIVATLHSAAFDLGSDSAAAL